MSLQKGKSQVNSDNALRVKYGKVDMMIHDDWNVVKLVDTPTIEKLRQY